MHTLVYDEDIKRTSEKSSGVIAIGETSTEVKVRWKQRNYRQYNVNLRYDTDGKLINAVEARKDAGQTTTDIFRKALEALEREGE